jgi:hypothetical protein
MRIGIAVVLLAFLGGCIHEGSSIIDPPIGIGAEESSLTVTESGLILSWMEPQKGDILLKMALHNGLRWSPARTIAKGDDWFVNWADFPAIVANGEMLFAHFLKKSASSTYAYDVMFTVSADMGESWSTPEKLHKDTVNAEHGFVSAVPYKDGFMVSWLDGRYTGEDNGAMTIRGAFVDHNGESHNATEIDHSTCDCCQTSMTVVNGIPWTFYRDRTKEEIRDIYFSKMLDDSWTEPVAIHDDSWLINACPVNGPMATSYKDNMAVVWFTAADGDLKTKLKISQDEGKTFSDVILVDSPKSLGRVDVEMDSSRIYVTFLSKKDSDSAIKLKVYNYQGELVSNEIMAIVSAERGTGFPRTAIWNNTLFISWTDVESNSIKILQYPLDRNHISARGGWH